MLSFCVVSLFAFAAILGDYSLRAQSAANDRIRLTLDTTEAECVLSILALRREGKAISETDWQKLFDTEPYRRLKKLEMQIGEMYHRSDLAFTDEDFKKFVMSDGLLNRSTQLDATLHKWRTVDLRASAERVLKYLPLEATINAKVYPTIKPNSNSFVFEPGSNPAIFLYLDPEKSAAKFENTVAHELHHIGLASLGPVYEKKLAGLTERARQAAQWMGAFGEGMAMLAAAGGRTSIPTQPAQKPNARAGAVIWLTSILIFSRSMVSSSIS